MPHGSSLLLLCLIAFETSALPPGDAQLTAELRRTMPELRGMPTIPMVIEGTIEATIAEDWVHPATPNHALVTERGERFQLHSTSGDAPRLQNGQRLRVSGLKLGGHLVVSSLPQPAASAEVPALSGVRKMAVVLYHYQTQAPPWSAAFARGVAFNDARSIRKYYREVSYGSLDLEGALNPSSGDVFGWYVLPGAPPTCGEQGSSAASALAAADGFVEANYQHVIYAFAGTSCGYVGKAEQLGRRVWFNDGAFNVGAVAHEIGHNLGLFHSPSLRCSSAGAPVAFSGACISNAYGDPYDIMGDAWEHRQLKPENKSRLGWLSPQQVSADSTIVLLPHELESSGVRALWVSEVGGATFQIEFRQPSGVFDDFQASDPAVQGVLIRTEGLLDMTPATPSFLDAALAVGQTFTDPATGLRVHTQSVGAAGATLNIAFGPCVRKTPSMTVSTAFQTTPSGGNPLTYQVGITNQDFTKCGPSTFSLTPTLPAPGWVQVPASPSAIIAPGQSASWELVLTSPASTPEGTYTIDQTASSASSGLTYVTSLLYEVKVPDTTPPARVEITAPLGGAQYRTPQVVAINVAVSSDVTHVDFFDGALPIGGSWLAPFDKIWAVDTFNNGPHVLTAKGFDEAGNFLVSAPVAVVVSIGTDLMISALATAPLTVARAGAFNANVTVSNQGSAGAGASQLSYVLSADAVFGGVDDLALAATSEVAALAPGADATLRADLAVPMGASLGQYFLCAAADRLNTVDEASETNNTRCTATAAIRVISSPPVLVSAAVATSNPVKGASVTLAVRASDDGAEANLTYHWEATTAPAPVLFSRNDVNAAKTTVAAFSMAGEYAFLVTVSDADGNRLSSALQLVVAATPTAMSLEPEMATLGAGQRRQFTATVTDQFGAALVVQPAVIFAVQGGGQVDAAGLFTAGPITGGPYLLTAKAAELTATAEVSVIAPDTRSPQVSLVAPLDQARVTGATRVVAQATDDVGVVKVRFSIDSRPLGDVLVEPFEISFDASLQGVGTHVLSARAFDAAGNSADSAQVSVVVEERDRQAPTVLVTSPVNGAVTGLGLTVSAIASDDVGVTQVDFELDGAIAGASHAVPYAVELSVGPGPHLLVAIARDLSGKTTRSEAVAFRAQPADDPAGGVVGGCGCHSGAQSLGMLARIDHHPGEKTTECFSVFERF